MITTALIAHVVLGLVGVGASYAAFMALVGKRVKHRTLRWSSVIAVISYVLSWLSGGYYYVVHYGTAVKPIIKAGDMPWAHSVFMEAKEHIFLFLPILSTVVVLVAFLLREELDTHHDTRMLTASIAGLAFVLSAAIALAGIVISGSVQ